MAAGNHSVSCPGPHGPWPHLAPPTVLECLVAPCVSQAAAIGRRLFPNEGATVLHPQAPTHTHRHRSASGSTGCRRTCAFPFPA